MRVPFIAGGRVTGQLTRVEPDRAPREGRLHCNKFSPAAPKSDFDPRPGSCPHILKRRETNAVTGQPSSVKIVTKT